MQIIVIDGPDGCGKTTIAKKLVEELQKLHLKAVYTHFPDYDYYTGKLIKECLYGKIGDFKNIPWKITTAMYDIDRYVWYKDHEKEYKDYVVVTDRYSLSSYQYQAAQYIWQGYRGSLNQLVQKNSDHDLTLEDLSERFFLPKILHYIDNARDSYENPLAERNYYINTEFAISASRLDNDDRDDKDNFEDDELFRKLVYLFGQVIISGKFNDYRDIRNENTDITVIDNNFDIGSAVAEILDDLVKNLKISINTIKQ